MSEVGRHSKRYATNQALSVRCESWGEFVGMHATDIGQGGMYVVTDTPPEVLSEVDVQIKLPEGHEVTLKARVVHVVDEALAEVQGRPPGVGVEFVEMEPEVKAQVHHLVEYARWEGSNENSASSYAKHMFELSASRPASEVLAALPTEPTAPKQEAPPPPVSRAPRKKPARDSVPQPEAQQPAVAEQSGAAEADTEQPGVEEPARNTGRMKKEHVGRRSHAEMQAAPDLPTLKLAMQHIAHKRYKQADTVLNEIIAARPEDNEAKKFLAMSQARAAVAADNQQAAMAAYKRLLSLDEGSREAREYVRAAGRNAVLDNIPFGRFFKKR